MMKYFHFTVYFLTQLQTVHGVTSQRSPAPITGYNSTSGRVEVWEVWRIAHQGRGKKCLGNLIISVCRAKYSTRATETNQTLADSHGPRRESSLSRVACPLTTYVDEEAAGVLQDARP